LQEKIGWKWERTDPKRSGSSGDIAKLFRHEEPKRPGIFAAGAPPAAATLMSREVIQNSWDAARELAEELPSAPQFHIQFRFRRLEADEKTKMVEALDLEALARRVEHVDRKTVGLRESDCLATLDDDTTPLRVLEIVENGATGMYGPWEQAKSHMYLALVSLGYTEKFSGAGGSYGYGKAGLIAGSRIRSVCAYSCFRPRTEEPGVTRRLLGMTYWGQHVVERESYTGFARFGEEDDYDPDYIRPFENERADAVASSFGIAPRYPGAAEELGTTFLLVDPTVEPEDLLRAIGRSWWPALVEGEFVASVIDYDDFEHHPRPRRDPVLKSFIDAWDIANGRSEPRREADHHAVIEASKNSNIAHLGKIGSLGLVTDLSGWSYADETVGPDQELIAHRSLVALTRGPKMVVEYYEAGQSPPYVRGAFVADQKVDELLRQAEPKAHDAWRSKSEDGDLDPLAAAVADTVLRKIRSQVSNHRQRLKPPMPKSEDVVLPAFNDIMRRFLTGGGRGVPQPVADTRPISIRLHFEPEVVDDQSIRVRGWVAFSLSEHSQVDAAAVELSIVYRYLEEDRLGEIAALEFAPPKDLEFVQVSENVFRGRLERDEEARFEFVSEAYFSDWSGRLVANGIILGEADEEEAAA
jgi:hypothetical protein